MIITSSAVHMHSQRKYHSISNQGGSTRFLGQLSHTAASAQNKINKDPDKEQNGQHLAEFCNSFNIGKARL